MTLSELVKLGDKIDVRLGYQVEQQKMGKPMELKNFKSSVFDYVSDTEMEILMPSDGGKIYLFETGIRLELLFYTNKGLYTCQAITKQHYKKENVYLLTVEIKSPPSKYQRREFFRVDCTLDMQYYSVNEEIAELASTEEVFCALQSEEFIGMSIPAIVQDISGGGIRFSSPVYNEIDSYIVIKLRLTNERLDETFFLACKIISCDRIEDFEGKYSNRAKFMFKDIKDRETIVKYVFEEQRRIRKKENG